MDQVGSAALRDKALSRVAVLAIHVNRRSVQPIHLEPDDHPALGDQLLQERVFVLRLLGLRDYREQLPPNRVTWNGRDLGDLGLTLGDGKRPHVTAPYVESRARVAPQVL